MPSKRIHLLDELRGLCVLLMVFFHGFYTLGYMIGWDVFADLFWFFEPVEPIFAGVFIALCGFSCHLSHSNLRRGLLLVAVAVGMSAVLYDVMPDSMIWFGVLHLQSVCILLFAAIRRLLGRVPMFIGIPVCIALFLLTVHLPLADGAGYFGWRGWFTVPTPDLGPWAYPIGMGYAFGMDYFPLLPWMFVFFGGAFLGHSADRLPAFCYRRHARPLAFLGRHALIIYLAHQPIIYGAAWLLSLVIA